MQKTFFKHDLVKILYEFQKLFHMWLQNPVFAVDDVEGSYGGFVVQGKHEDLVGGGQVFGGAGGENRDAKAACHGFADGFQVIHSGNNVQGGIWNMVFFQIAVDFLFGAGSGFAHDKWLLEKI